MAAPIDLCVNLSASPKAIESSILLIKTAIKLGYEAITINKCVDISKGQTVDFVPVTLDDNISSALPLCRYHKKMNLHTRLTVTLGDDATTQKLSHPSALAFDIIAVRPTSEKTLLQACTTLPVDIITFDLDRKLEFPFKRGSISAAIERGIHFEVCYSQMITNDTSRRHVITNAYELVRFCSGKNIVMSSGSTQMMELRAPMDVANLTHLFGMDANKRKETITTNCHAVLRHAESRKSIKSVLTIERVQDIDDRWLLKKITSTKDCGEQEIMGTKKRKSMTSGKDDGKKKGDNKRFKNKKDRQNNNTNCAT